MTTCRICRDKIDIEDDARFTLNPVTFKWAMMHNDCLRNAYEDLKGVKVKGPYKDKQDKYNCICAGVEW